MHTSTLGQELSMRYWSSLYLPLGVSKVFEHNIYCPIEILVEPIQAFRAAVRFSTPEIVLSVPHT